MITLWMRGIAFRWKTDPKDPRVEDLVKPEWVTMCKLAHRVVFQTSHGAFVKKFNGRLSEGRRDWNGAEWAIMPDDVRVTFDGHCLRVQPSATKVEDKSRIIQMRALLERANGKAQEVINGY